MLCTHYIIVNKCPTYGQAYTCHRLIVYLEGIALSRCSNAEFGQFLYVCVAVQGASLDVAELG